MPTIALHSRVIVPNNATQATSDTGGSGGGAYDPLPPQYISALVLFVGFFLISILAIIAYALLFCLSRTGCICQGLLPLTTTPHRRATRSESPASNVEDNAGLDRRRQHDNPGNLFHQNSSSRTHDARAVLNAVSPATPFGRLQSQGDSQKNKATENKDKTKRPTPPDQTGTAVACIICLDDFQPESSVRVLPCGHIFHAECIDEWLLAKHHFSCPLCGKSYLPDGMVLPTEPRPTHVATSNGLVNHWGFESPPFVTVPLR